jgi:hypothetical protein
LDVRSNGYGLIRAEFYAPILTGLFPSPYSFLPGSSHILFRLYLCSVVILSSFLEALTLAL